MKKNNISIFILAFFISLFIWFALKFTRTQQVNVQIPIAISNVPTSLIPIEIEPKSINLIIGGRGDKLVKFHLQEYSYYLNLKNAHYGKNYISFDTENIEGLEKYELKIIQNPEIRDILVILDNMTTMSFQVNPVFADAESKEFFESQNYDVSPREIQIKGPKKIIKEFIHINTQPFNVKKHSKNTMLDLLIPENDLITTHINSVKIVQSKPKLIQKTFPLIPISHPDTLQIFPRFVSLKIAGDSKLLGSLSKQDFEIGIAVPDSVIIGDTLSLDIKLPDEVELISQTPEKVKFRGIKKNSPTSDK